MNPVRNRARAFAPKGLLGGLFLTGATPTLARKDEESVRSFSKKKRANHWKFYGNSGNMVLMVISYFGEGCFRVQSGDTSLLVDPINNRLKADVTLKTLSPAHIAAIEPNEVLFPGEYELKGLEIRGWEIPTESTEKFLKTAYRVDWEDISLAFLGHISKPIPPELIDKLGEPDIVFLPAGGGHFLSPELATKTIKQLEPHIVIPSFFSSPKDFLKAMGQKAEVQEKFVFKKKDIVNELGKVVVLRGASESS